MRTIYLIFLAAASLFLASSCLKEECRDCAPFNYEAAALNPDFTEEDLVMEDADGREYTFNYLRTVSTPGREVCLGQVDSPDDIVCSSSSDIGFRSEELGIDMLIAFETQARFGQRESVVMSFEFKGQDATQFARTHLVIVEPEITRSTGVVEFRDTITLRDSLYQDVYELIRPAETFVSFGDALPAEGRFSSIYFQPGMGLLGMRGLDGGLFLTK